LKNNTAAIVSDSKKHCVLRAYPYCKIELVSPTCGNITAVPYSCTAWRRRWPVSVLWKLPAPSWSIG